MVGNETLYRINDVLTALAADLGVVFEDENDEDERLDAATHAVYGALFDARPDEDVEEGRTGAPDDSRFVSGTFEATLSEDGGFGWRRVNDEESS
jgi:hypothetical protein